MFLKTVRPVVAVHSEWTSGKSLSLPLCFNDSAPDTDFVTSSGTPIPHKVQMIIDSLCSTQSSDMSNEVNATTQSARNLSETACVDRKSCHMDTLAKSQRVGVDNSKLHASGCCATEGSDTDDSVDRGIEEAIQEYLKEKVDHRHKSEPVESPIRTPKVQLGGNCLQNSPKEVKPSTKVLTNSNHNLKVSKEIQPLVPLRKKKRNVKENLFEKTGAGKSLPTKASHSCSTQVDCRPPSVRINMDEDTMDSSSDDGIEEAIQKFQQEEKERHEGLRYFQLKEVLDSSSDDGIEEAIQSYQQERQKEKEHKVDPKLSCFLADHISVKPLPKSTKKKEKKKNTVEQKLIKSTSRKSDGLPLSTLPTCCLRASGDLVCSNQAEEPQDGQQIHSTLTANTTAELMCAEAILDISKTVMPAIFEPSLNLSSNPTTETQSCLAKSVSVQKYEKSDESSVDSEDGIEQEIRKYLDLKAKATTTPYPGVCAVTQAQKHIKVKDNQNKTLRLSYSQKRKWKEDSKICKQVIVGNSLREEPQHKLLTQNAFSPVKWHSCSTNMAKNCSPTQNITEVSTSLNKGSCGQNPPKSFLGSERNYRSDKSSSLDSDEDLDAAIKDLLKTKKKVKKKVRDMKLEARKYHNSIQPSGHTLKKQKSVKAQRLILATKPMKSSTTKNSHGLMSISKLEKGVKPKVLKSQKNSKKYKVSTTEDKMVGHGVQNAQIHEDTSSVDSDDSIEQEIRKFLAEKAKVSSTSVTILKQDNAGGTEEAAFSSMGEKTVKLEVVQTKSSDLLRASLSIHPNQEEHTQCTVMNVLGPDSSFNSHCSLENDSTGVAVHERTSLKCKSNSLDGDKDWAQKVTGRFTDRPDSEPFVINVTGQHESKGEVQHQNLFLMKHDNCSISTAREKHSAVLSNNLQNRSRMPLIEVISTVCPSPPLGKQFLGSSSETLMVDKKDCQLSPGESRSDSIGLCRQWEQPPNLASNIRHTFLKPKHLSHHQPLYPSHLSCVPLPLTLSQPRAGASLGQLHRDQASVVAHKSNYLQLRKTQKDARKMSEDRQEEQEQYIDEADIESGDDRTDKRQQQCSQSLSTCIDPGVLLSPYIALNTEERSQKFRHSKQRVLKSARKKLQFVFSNVMMKSI